ncbi:MAG: hypothetical protein AB7H80_08275 [Candidatus Kapaibacterium sp.]
MGLTNFNQLPDHARLWAFTSGQKLSEDQQQLVEATVREFLDGWAAHGADLTAGAEIVHDRFLLVGVDQDLTAPSGCSIDAMTRFLRDFGNKIGVDFLDSPNCSFRIGEEITSVDRATFRKLAEEGKVDSDTTVFDLTVPTVGDLRAGKFETSADKTWYAKAFPLSQPTP